MSKVSAIDAIICPFNICGNSSQTEVTHTVKFGGEEINATYRVRTGKTAKDKAKGHIPYKKNRRIWEDGGSGRNAAGGRWVKV